MLVTGYPVWHGVFLHFLQGKHLQCSVKQEIPSVTSLGSPQEAPIYSPCCDNFEGPPFKLWGHKSIINLNKYISTPFSVIIAFNGNLRHLDQKIQDKITETYLSSCNSSLNFETRQDEIPPVYESSTRFSKRCVISCFISYQGFNKKN